MALQNNAMAYWMANANEQKVCNISRVSAVKKHSDEHLVLYVPASFLDPLLPHLENQKEISLLMASLNDFESYQFKGHYVEYTSITPEDVAYYTPKLNALIELCNSMGLKGNLIFDPFLTQKNVAVTFYCREIFEQTPKKGTGKPIIV